MNNLSINNFPKISVIMPSFNSALYISEAIESFLDQSYQVKELIIVDGKSTDNTHEIIQLYLNKHDNIHWLKEPDTCVTDAINKGIKFSSFYILLFLVLNLRE